MSKRPEKMKGYGDLPEDGGSRILDQVLEQRNRIKKSLDGFKQVVAIGSGKGGVGKSTVTMLLALGLKEQGLSPAILDADFNGPSQARLSGLGLTMPLPGQNGLAIPVAGSGIAILSVGSYLPESEAFDFSSVATGDSFVWRASKEFSVLGEMLVQTDWGECDFLLIDMPPGAERVLQYAEFFPAEVDFVLVTQPSGLSAGVVQRSISALQKVDARLVGVVENMSGYLCPNCSEIQPLFPRLDRNQLKVPLLGSIPFDPELALACDKGISTDLFSRLAWKDNVLNLVGALTGNAGMERSENEVFVR